MKDSQPLHVLITPTTKRPALAEVKRLIGGKIPDAAIQQAIAALPAVEQWLTHHPDAAARLITDPAATLETMRQSGALTGSIDDLLTLLRSEPPKTGDATTRTRQWLAEVFHSATASFGPARKKGDR